MIIGYYGKPRSGKGTFGAYIVAQNDIKKKLNRIFRLRLPVYSVIYSCEYMRGCVKVLPYDIGTFEPPEGALFLIQEAGVHFNNRIHAKIPTHCTEFFAKHGHYKCDIIWDSQDVDVDKKLRNRTHILYEVHKFLHWSYRKVIRSKIGVDEQSHDIVNAYYLSSGFLAIFDWLARQNLVIYRPFYYDRFDSFCKDMRFHHAAPTELYPDDGHRDSFFKKIRPAFEVAFYAVGLILALILALYVTFNVF